ncbi:LysR family transcriptional regulator [Sulfitobacter sp.]|jgi:DNA-binding transcriptional LysR family regulator|uniref:LysR family transcriptional regulator n=1 Tax=Sulfitobacter sp. TaxID=1903071 RepID=UPI000C3D8F83|nr:LysR family transcriptional regulator [Roseobacter sp.]THF74957.1 MAG: LysR family transcriptional regulator [Sulfitobacter sp. SK025]|tara:strand:+ start:43 stop:945 length:903 start_codon:yes stop_codon:yes gene_type:complete
MNFKHLKYFVATADTGQVSRAARLLSISQSSVTGSVRELEAILGVTLFERRAQGMELTKAGREFLQVARDILEKVDAAYQIRRGTSDISGTLKVAATYTVLGYFLPFHLGRMAQLYPHIDIQIVELNRQNIEEQLLHNQIDMAVALTSNIQREGIETLTLLKSPRRVWVPTGHVFCQGGEVSLHRIAEEPYVMLTVDEAAHSSMKYWNSHNAHPNIKLRTSSVEAVRSIVANDQGVTILSDMVYRPWSLEGRRIETVPTDVEIPTMDVGLAFNRATAVTPAMKALKSYFYSAFLSPKLQF